MYDFTDFATLLVPDTHPNLAGSAGGYAVHGLPFGLHTTLIVMICAALAAMVLRRRIPGLPLNACLSVLVAFGTVLAARQTGQREIAVGGFCVIVAIYTIEYFSRIMLLVERDHSRGPENPGDEAPAPSAQGAFEAEPEASHG